MKQLLTADWHININNRIKDVYKIINNILTIAIDEQVERIVILGDIFDKARPRHEEKYIFYRWLEKTKKTGIKVLLLKGNHDIFKSPILGDFFSFADANILNNVKIMDSEYIENNIYYGHCHIQGAIFGNTDDINFNAIGKDIKELYNHKCKLYFLGHIHKAQKINNNVYYLGSPYKINFGECNNDNSVIIHNMNTNELKFIKISDRKMIEIHIDMINHKWEQVDVTDAIIKVKVKIKEDQPYPTQDIKEKFKNAYEIRSIEFEVVKKEHSRNKDITTDKSVENCFLNYCNYMKYEKIIQKRGVAIINDI